MNPTRRRRYHTHYRLIDLGPGSTPRMGAEARGKGWHFRVGSLAHGERSDPERREFRRIRRGQVDREVYVHAPHRELAQHACNLLRAAYGLVQGGRGPIDQLFERPRIAVPVDKRRLEGLSAEQVEAESGTFLAAPSVWWSANVAAKASLRLKTQQALFKFALSQAMYSIDTMAFHPDTNRDLDKNPPRYAEELVALAQAVVSAYGVIEELGLEIRASGEKPSRLPTGAWHPEVLSDLAGRLSHAGINTSEDLFWTVRHRSRQIDLRSPIHPERPAEWAQFHVSDVMVKLPEAIRRASFLRSKCSAHSLASLSKSMTVVEVVNVQNLARRLFLERLGIWRWRVP